MKALTIQQPFASLIACEVKHFETRSWKTGYRGKIAIHAGLKTCNEMYSAIVEKACDALPWDEVLPIGAIVAVADLVECWHIASENMLTMVGRYDSKVPESEHLFGDFTAGRYAWELRNVRRLPKPIPCKGKQSLWNVPEDMEIEIESRLS